MLDMVVLSSRRRKRRIVDDADCVERSKHDRAIASDAKITALTVGYSVSFSIVST